MNVLLLCFLLSSLVGNALSATYVVEPLDIQLPLIARIGQPFSWTFSERTFNSSEGSLNYTTSALPSWLSFHPDNRTFSGVPGPEDEGNPRVVVTARSPNPNSYASSGVNLCVTHYPAPTVRIPISDQFSAPGRALSSVFPLQPRSALATSNPALRIPQGWSFSVGFQASTVSSPNDLFYEARSADGSELPTWMVFDPDAVTLDGVVPQDVGSAAPEVMSFILVGSDQEGYTALALPFDLVVANHELSSSTDELPTINVTTGNTFTVNLLSPADFMGILVDGDRIQPANISMLNIDTSAYSQWLQYDPVGRTLSGNPGPDVGDTKPVLPVTLTTAFNQTIHTAVTLQLVPSYFALPELPALHLSPGDDFDLQLDQFYSNSTAGQRGDADISLTYDPVQAADFVRFDGSGDRISGAIPRDFGGDHITVSFTAYSRITHSTSHANLVVFVSPSPGGRDGQIGRPAGLSAQARRKLALGLGIAFGAVGGFLAMIAFFACCRRWTRVEDTALTGEEGRMGYTEKDRRYYGFGSSNPSLLQRPEDVARTEASIAPSRNAGEYGAVDLDLQRMPARSQSIPGSYMPSDIMSSGMISKREFMTRIKQTVRQVSDKYTRKPQVSSPRPVIGKPILLRPSVAMDNNATPDVTYPMQSSVSNPFDDRFSQRGSTFMTGSPSTSTAEHSIPRRRADFGPPRAMAQVHFNDGKLVRQGSSGSMKSDRPGRSSRQTSVRSGRSTRTTSYLSHEYYPDGDPASARPRLVPFTSSTRVPVPRVSSLVVPGADDSGGGGGGGFAKSRVASQRARIYKGNAKDEDDPFAENARRRKSVSADDLSMGLHYVQSLGNDQSAPAEPATGMTRVMKRHAM
ncbi:hypothetical protein EST38_g3716 [Candolleomyces aberdarensis]|uniref:Dystroglycan-type cadherin-like domain-containing protein n=1 Tax=Candolleomyces aberdarensis TaxID=2316362 RepID=A0A4Q2DP88_9AGAR|nr:hypothetical protein EST38_g3716 [Candolleomyces aberdarensis]